MRCGVISQPPPAKRWSKIRVAKQQGEGGLRGWVIFFHSPPPAKQWSEIHLPHQNVDVGQRRWVIFFHSPPSVTWSVIPGRHPLQRNDGRRSVLRSNREKGDKGGGLYSVIHPPQRDVVGNTGHSPPPAKQWSEIHLSPQNGDVGQKGWVIFCHSPPPAQR